MPQFPRVGDLFGRYRIDSQIGQGGMGVVFGATDTAFDRQVALKVVSASLGGSAEFLARFEREASLLARLNSPHVIAIFDYGEQDGCPYIATQFVGGGDLGGLIAARGPMPPALAATVCAQVADALADAHRAGVVHRDVKPTNVLLRDADTVEMHAYLCDFGIARTESDGLTAPGSVTGTWSYLAPEVGAGATGTAASDLYATGCLLWAALTGHAPYGGSDVEIAIAHQRSPVPQLLGEDPFTRHVNAILSNTLAKDPRSRYPDADALRADLLTAATIPTGGVRPTPLPQSAPAPTPTPSGRPFSGASTGSPSSLPPTAPPPGHAIGHPTANAPRSRRRTTVLVALSAFAVLAVAGGIVGVGALDDDPPPATGGTSAGGEPGEPSSPPAPSPPPAPAPVVERPVTGDLDGDGLGDLSVRAYAQQPTATRKGRFAWTTWTSTGRALVDPLVEQEAPWVDSSTDRVIGDFDGDDLLEVIEFETPANMAKDPNVTGTLSGGGVFDQKVRRPGGGRYVTSLAGDVDLDGVDDLVLVTWGQSDTMRVAVSLVEGERVRNPSKALEIPAGFSNAEVEAGDFDGDGRVDIAVVESPDVDYDQKTRAYVRTYLGTARNTFRDDGRPRQFISEIGTQVVTGDLDGDGDAELVVGLNKRQFIQLSVLDYSNDEGMGKARAVGLLPLPEESFFDSSIVTGDFDGDGLDDVLSTGPSAAKGKATIQVARSRGARFATATRWATWRFELTGSYGASPLGTSFP